MTLKLSFFRSEDTDIPYQTASFDLEDSGKKPRILVCNLVQSGGLFHDCTYVEASLIGVSNAKGRYRLQLAYKPDFMPVTDKDGDFSTVDGNTRLQLLRGACGLSLMRLLFRNSTAAKWEERFVFRIEVEPSREKRFAMNSLVDELMNVRPQEVFSRFEGLSQTRIERRWVKGEVSADWWSALIKYDEMKKLYVSILPWLRLLIRNSSVNLALGFRYMSMENLRRMPCKTVHDIEKKAAIQTIGRKVWGPIVRESRNIDIHRAIKDFLIRFKAEAAGLQGVVTEAISRDKIEIKELVARDELWKLKNKSQLNQWDIEDKKNEVAAKEQMVNDIRSMLEGCASLLLGSYPWSRCDRLPIVYVPISSVPSSEQYQYLYARMLQFVQKRFFWSSVNGRFFVPRYVRYSEGEPSAWQKNYSYIYEVWVFKRIIEAFSREGFEEISEKYREKACQMLRNLQLGPVANEPVHAEMTNGRMRVDIFHGLRAYKRERGDRWSEFTSCGGGRLTPDFAIIFTNPDGVGAQSFHWIVLDAKSCWKLDEKATSKRDMYLNKFLRYDEPPDQSWLVYSGEYNGSAKIEFDDVNDGHFKWRKDLGIEGWSDRRVNVCGHLRVNCNTVESYDVFREFAKVEIITAKNRLGVS